MRSPPPPGGEAAGVVACCLLEAGAGAVGLLLEVPFMTSAPALLALGRLLTVMRPAWLHCFD